MPVPRTLYSLRVFLGSPGDVTAEREAVETYIKELNATYCKAISWHIELMSWKNVPPQPGRGQEVINDLVRQSDIFVGLMHEKWGSDTGKYPSGFQEEYELADKLYEEGKMSLICIYFKEMRESDDLGPQRTQVQNFRKRLEQERKYLYYPLSTELNQWTEGFRQTFFQLVFKAIQKLTQSQEGSEGSEGSDAKTEPEAEITTQNAEELQESERENLVLVRAISDRIVACERDDQVPPIDVVRLRLLTLGWPNYSLSIAHLGTHDANIAYMHRNDVDFSKSEIAGLVYASLSTMNAESAPLWHWLRLTNTSWTHLYVATLSVDDASIATGALSVLTASGIAMPKTFSSMLRQSIERPMSNVIKNAILSYLARNGTDEDIPGIRNEIKKAEYATTTQAIGAALEILCRQSVTKAFEFLVDNNTVSPSAKTVSDLFSKAEPVSSEILAKGLSHGSSNVRENCARILRIRKALSDDQERTLLSDSSASVRKETLLASIDRGEVFDDDVAQKVLNESKTGGIFSVARAAEEDLLIVRRAAFQNYSDQKLQSEMYGFYSPAEVAYEFYMKRHFRTEKMQVFADLEDNFVSFFERTKTQYVEQLGSERAQRFTRRFGEFADFRARAFARAALNVLVASDSKKDADVVKRFLSDANVRLENQDLDFYSRFGDWADIASIDKAMERHWTLTNSLLGGPPAPYRQAALAAYKIGKKALPELLQTKLRPELLCEVVTVCEKAAFRKLDQTCLLLLLNHEYPKIRKATALQIIRGRTKAYIAQLLDEYLRQEARYYNVVYWLDLGLNAPRETIAATFEHFLDS